MFTTEGNRTTHANVEEGEAGDNEETGLPEGHREPKPDRGGGVAGDGIPGGPTEILAHGLPCEDGQGKEITTSEPEVTLICGGNRPIVRKTKFGLLDEGSGQSTVLGEQ